MPEINNGAKLKRWIDDTERWKNETDEKFKRFDNALSNFNINKNEYKDSQSETLAAMDYQIAKFFRAVTLKDKSTIGDMGGVISPKNFGRTSKTDLGTPLTGDDSGTTGSYLIPTQLYGDWVIRWANVASEIIPQLRKVTMEGRLIRWPVETASTSLTFVTNEATSKTETNPTISYVDLECETFAGWTGVTDEFLEDSMVDIGAWLRQMITQDYVDTVEEQALVGSGSPFTGVTNYTSNESLVIDGTAFDEVTWADLRSLKNQLATKRKRQRCAYFMHPTIWDILCSQQDGNGRYFFDPSRGGPRTAWGYPVLLSDSMPDEDESATSTAFIGFGPLSQILYGVRVGLEIKYFDQTMYAVQDDENFYRYRTRFGIKCGKENAFAVMSTAAS